MAEIISIEPKFQKLQNKHQITKSSFRKHQYFSSENSRNFSKETFFGTRKKIEMDYGD